MSPSVSPASPYASLHPADCGQIARTACRLASIPDRRPAHNCVFPQATVASSLVCMWLQFAISRIQVSPHPRGRTPGLLSAASSRTNGEELVVGHGEIGMCQFALCLLEYVNNIIGDAVSVGIISHHVGWKIDQFTGMKAPAISIEMGKQLFGSNVGVE